MTTPVKRHYVRMEVIGAGPKFDGHVIWICPWEDKDDAMTWPMEELEDGQPWTVKFTVLEMTDDEYTAYCVEHEIEVDE